MTKRYQPYSPMGPPKKHVSQQDMLSILEKHKQSEPSKPKQELPPSDPVHPGRLQWKKPVINPRDGTGYCETVCGRFTVEKSLVNNIPVYCGWKRLSEWRFVLGSTSTSELAKELCQKESDRPTLIKAQEICST